MFLQGLPEAFDLALRGGFEGLPVLLRDAQVCQEGLERVAGAVAAASAAAGEAGGVDHAVVGERRGRVVVLCSGVGERFGDDAAGDTAVGAEVQQVAGVVVEPADDFDVGAVGGVTWVKSDCQSSFGRSAVNRIQEERGRFCGCGATCPAAFRIRQIVTRDTVMCSR